MYGTFDSQKGILSIQNAEYSCFENNKCAAFYDGHPSSRLEAILEESNLESDWMEAFIGPFALILLEKNSGKLLITQHLFGNGKNLYLCKKDDMTCLASSLRELKKIAGISFKLNEPMLPYYFYNGFLPGNHTLIEGVQKLEAGVCFIMDGHGIHKRALPFTTTDTAPGSLADEYKNALASSIRDVTRDIMGPVSLALSGGYDSNCILYSMKKRWPAKKINAFSVGGVHGINETEIAAYIAGLYETVNFKAAFVSPDTLEHLDEIVAALEGSVYERGVFLQFELAKLLQSNCVPNLICGECADQVFHQNTYVSIPENTFLFGYLDTPYQMASYVVLQKSRMMMDAFGVDTRYPFLTPQMIAVGYKSRKLNGVTKEFHKAQCKDMFPREVLDSITKQGGATDLASLFPEGFDCSAKLEKRKYYSADFKLTGKYTHKEAVRDYYVSLLYLESFEKQFCDK